MKIAKHGQMAAYCTKIWLMQLFIYIPKKFAPLFQEHEQQLKEKAHAMMAKDRQVKDALDEFEILQTQKEQVAWANILYR